MAIVEHAEPTPDEHPAEDRNPTGKRRARAGILLATISLGLMWLYFAIVGLLNETVAGIHVRLVYVAVSFPIICGFFCRLTRWLVRRRLLPDRLLQQITLLVVVSLGSVLLMDIVYSISLNFQAHKEPDLRSSRSTDPITTIGELYPRLFYPTDRNFRLHKPNYTVSGEHYGGTYSPKMMASPTLVKSVLQLRRVSFSIDAHGFRETTPLEQADTFSLGDSFTFGWGVEAEKSWVGLLERATGHPIYNLGVHDSSPRQELELLKYVLKTQGDSMTVRRLLWMIYEGNDLEDSYAIRRPETQGPMSVRQLFAGTLVDSLIQIPWVIKRQAVITKLRTGIVRNRVSTLLGAADDPYTVDGVKLSVPIYRSATLGPRLFYPTDIIRAGKPLSYVLNHPHRRLLEQVFDEMAQLRKQFHFKVTVIIAPTAARLHGPYYDHFPPVTKNAHFIDFVADLSDRRGFQTINLFKRMQPFSDREPLYFRDDDHWNEKGHELAAEIIARELFQ